MALLLGLAPVAALSQPQTQTLAQTQVAKPAAPLMWVIRDADSTLYLFGTIHAMRDDADWFTPLIRQRFDESSELWLEVADLDDTARMVSVSLPYVLNPKNNMTEGLSEDEIATLDRHLDSYGMQRKALMGIRKWAVGVLLAQKQYEALGLNAESGIDMTLLRQARQDGKTVKGFETIEDQLAILAPSDPEQETQAFRAMLEELDEGPDMVASLLTAWLEGDEAALEHYLTDEMRDKDPQGYDRFLAQRNANWVPKIEDILRGKGTVFIAVGGAHLVGPDSVIALLRKKGIQAERIATAN